MRMVRGKTSKRSRSGSSLNSKVSKCTSVSTSQALPKPSLGLPPPDKLSNSKYVTDLNDKEAQIGSALEGIREFIADHNSLKTKVASIAGVDESRFKKMQKSIASLQKDFKATKDTVGQLAVERGATHARLQQTDRIVTNFQRSLVHRSKDLKHLAQKFSAFAHSTKQQQDDVDERPSFTSSAQLYNSWRATLFQNSHRSGDGRCDVTRQDQSLADFDAFVHKLKHRLRSAKRSFDITQQANNLTTYKLNQPFGLTRPAHATSNSNPAEDAPGAGAGGAVDGGAVNDASISLEEELSAQQQ